jgi:hypothetical protein
MVTRRVKKLVAWLIAIWIVLTLGAGVYFLATAV